MDTEKDTIEELILKMDQESREFELLKKMDSFLVNLKKDFDLTDEQQNIIDGEITLFLLKENTVNVFYSNLEKDLGLTMKPEVSGRLIIKIKSFLHADTFAPKDSMSKTPVEISNDLTKIKQTLINPITITPTTRDHSTLPTSAPAASTPRPIDPYRELPDEK